MGKDRWGGFKGKPGHPALATVLVVVVVFLAIVLFTSCAAPMPRDRQAERARTVRKTAEAREAEAKSRQSEMGSLERTLETYHRILDLLEPEEE